ncbi:MAG: hypothetical protein ACFCVG_07685 [Kineosporiaceae bacterium]
MTETGSSRIGTSGSAPNEAATFVQSQLFFYMAGAAVLMVMVAGARIAWARRSGPAVDLLRALLTMVLVSAAGLTAISLATQAADGFSSWIIDESLAGSDLGETLGFAHLLTGGLSSLVVIVVGLLALVASIVQIVLLVVRTGVLILLAGILPLSASFTGLETGRTWFQRVVTWTLAFILYKPAAAIVYATAFRLTGSEIFTVAGGGTDEEAVLDVVVGLSLMVVAILALPTLLRALTPMVGALSGGNVAAGGMTAVNTGASLKSLVPRRDKDTSSAGGPTGASAPGPNSRGPDGAAAAGPDAAPRAGSASGEAARSPSDAKGSVLAHDGGVAAGPSGRDGSQGPRGAEGRVGSPGAGAAPGGARTGAAAGGKAGAAAGATAGAAAAGPAVAAAAAAVAAAGAARRGTQIPGDLIRDAVGDGPRGSR